MTGHGSVVRPGVVYALQFAAFSAWGAYAVLYIRSLGVDLALIGVLFALLSGVGIVAATAWGTFADRLGSIRRLYLVAAATAALAAVVVAAAPPLPVLVLATVINATSASGLGPMLDARTLQRLWPDRERFGVVRAWGSISSLATPVIVGAVVSAAGLTSVFWIYALALVAAGTAASLLLRGPDEGPRVGGIGPLVGVRLLSSPGLLLFFVGSVLVWVSANSTMVFFSLRVIEIGREPWLVGVALAANTVLEIPVMLAFPRLARRFSVERLLVVGALLIVARQVLWSLTESPAPFIVVTTLGGASFALLVVGTASYIASHVPAQLQATSQALFAGAAYGIGSIAGALIAGQVAASSGLAGLYPVATAVGALGALLMIAGITRLRPPAPRASTTAPRGQQVDGRMPTDTGARPR